jgi:hypothetical protein
MSRNCRCHSVLRTRFVAEVVKTFGNSGYQPKLPMNKPRGASITYDNVGKETGAKEFGDFGYSFYSFAHIRLPILVCC